MQIIRENIFMYTSIFFLVLFLKEDEYIFELKIYSLIIS